MTSKQLLKKIRAHVAEHGVTGGSLYAIVGGEAQTCCPRGLVLHYSGEWLGDRSIWGVPKTKAAREVLTALDKVAKRRGATLKNSFSGSFHTPVVIGDGGLSETYAYRVEQRGPNIKRALSWIDAAEKLL